MPYAMLQVYLSRDRNEDARAASVKMDVRAILVVMIGLSAIEGAGCVAILPLVIISMMVSVMGVGFMLVIVRVDDDARKGASWRCKAHAERGRDGKEQRHRPHGGNTSSARFSQSHDHLMLLIGLPDRHAKLGFSEALAKPLTL
jgi:hypothetical protein